MRALLEITSHIPCAGTLVNATAIVAGGFLGLGMGTRISRKYSVIGFQAFGLFTLFLGISMAFRSDRYMLVITSLLVGSLIGQFFDLEGKFDRLGVSIKTRLHIENARFVEGFISSSLLFCTGSMAIMGSIEEGLGGTPNLLLTKALMDGFAATIFASTMGCGVLLSSIPILLYQGGMTLGASLFQEVLTPPLIDLLSSTGGILLMGLGFNLLEIKKFQIGNMLPALLVAELFGTIFI